MCADKNPCGCNLTKHGIENRPVVPILNGIKPYKNTVKQHKLFTNFRTKIVVIDRRLGVHPFESEGSEQVCKPVIFNRGVFSSVTVARIENRDSSDVTLHHKIFPHGLLQQIALHDEFCRRVWAKTSCACSR